MTDLKPGVKIEFRDNPHEVISSSFSKVSKGQGFVTARLRNMVNGNVFENVFRDRDNIVAAYMEKNKAQFLYKQNDKAVFMDNTTFEQFEIGEKVLGDKENYLIEGMEVEIIIYKEAPLTIELPAKVSLKVTDTEPAIKSATASDVKKQAVLETGYKLSVPSFINEGDVIRINTSTGEYVERA